MQLNYIFLLKFKKYFNGIFYDIKKKKTTGKKSYSNNNNNKKKLS